MTLWTGRSSDISKETYSTLNGVDDRRFHLQANLLDSVSLIARLMAFSLMIFNAYENSVRDYAISIIMIICLCGIGQFVTSTKPRHRKIYLVHGVGLLCGLLVLLTAQELLPWLDNASDHKQNRVLDYAMTSLAIALLATALTPLERPLPVALLRLTEVGMEEEDSTLPSTQESTSWLNGFFWYGWLYGIVHKAWHKDGCINLEDLPMLSRSDRPVLLLEEIRNARFSSPLPWYVRPSWFANGFGFLPFLSHRYWPSLFWFPSPGPEFLQATIPTRTTAWTTVVFLLPQLTRMILWTSLAAVFALLSPFAMKHLLSSVESREQPSLNPWI